MYYAPHRKAQADASAAATLVALLALLIIFYLLFIPPEFRDQILEGNQTGTAGTGSGATANDTLLFATPGTLTPIDIKDIEHNIGAVYLFARENAKILETRTNLYTRSTFMRQESANMTFAVSDLENTENVLLTFRATTKSRGRLIISLNGNEIFNGQVTQENVEPLRLSKANLLQGTNTLEFKASTVGWLFWRTNEFGLQTLQITADVTDVSQQKSQNSFIVSATEKNNVQRSVLRFAPDCDVSKVGKLDITLNGHSVYSTLPDCGSHVTIEFAPDILREGENLIIFRTEKGNYLVDLIKVTSEMKQITQPVFYFDVTQGIMDDVRAGRYRMELRLTFLDSKELKTGKINFNGHETNIYQKERDYKKDITDWLVLGSNAVKVTPNEQMEVLKLEVAKKR